VDALAESVSPLTEAADVSPDDASRGWFFAASSESDLPDAEPLDVRLTREVGAAYDAFVTGGLQLAAGAAGGPLLDLEGRLLGMAVGCTFEVDATTGAPTANTLFVQGSDVRRVVDDLLRDGCVRRPMLGVLLDDGSNRIDLILPDGPAARAGLLEGDLLIEIGGVKCARSNCIVRALLRRRIGEQLTLRVRRGDDEFERSVELAPVCEPETSSAPPLPGVALELTA
jgi:S1-C subfamily serine protease